MPGASISNYASADVRFTSLAELAMCPSRKASMHSALVGGSLLPGKKFNLTANVGTYGGAYAGALQVGAMVSESVATNAGVAKGFNRDGKTAARAGFTLGF